MWYNQTEVATKEELENVKGMIEVSAKIVYSTNVSDRTTSVTIPVEYDYVIITTITYSINYDNTGRSCDLYQFDITVNKGGSAIIPTSYTHGSESYYGSVIATASASAVDFSRAVNYTNYSGITITAYKYSR